MKDNHVLLICLLSAVTAAFAADLIDGANKFANKLYNVLPNEGNNLIFAPFSAHNALSLVYQGADGKTAENLRQGLNVPIEDRAVREYGHLLTSLKAIENVTLHLANTIYVKDGYKLNDKFRTIARHDFLANAQNIDFLKSTAVDEINAWVRKNTNNKIDKLVSEDDFNQYTRSVILNAIYFKGYWLRKFDKAETSVERFYVSETETINCPMMHQTDEYYYYEDDKLDAQVIKLNYKDNRVKLVVILPNSRTGVDDLERKLASTDISTLVDTYGGAREVILSLPKFKIETTLQLKEPLLEIGLGNIFDDRAEFSNLIDSSKDLKIDEVVQKAYIEVNEEGSEAAAGTGVFVALPVSLHYSPAPPVVFKADHPFIFYITARLYDREGHNHLILFMGKVNAPNIVD